MTDKEIKLSVIEKLRLLGFGIKTIHNMTPTYLPFTLLRSLIIGFTPMMVLFFSARILNELSAGGSTGQIITYVALTLGLMFILSLFRGILTREIETYSAWERIFTGIQRMQAKRFTQMDYTYAEDPKISEVLARMDTQARGNGLGLLNVYHFFIPLTEGFFSMVFAFLLLNVFSLGGSTRGYGNLVLIGMVALGLTVTFLYASRENIQLARIYKENAKANTVTNFYVNQYLNSDKAAKDIRLYNQKESLIGIMQSGFDPKSWMPFFFFCGRQQGFTLAINAAISGIFFLIIGYNALDGSIAPGGIIQNVGAITVFASSIGGFIYMLGRLWTNAAFIRPMREFLTLPDLLQKGSLPVAGAENHTHRIEFRNVSFRYPGTEIYALSNLNLCLTPGERLAVVGVNGSGKTTMIKLLCRLYDPTEGEILLDGVNIKEYNYEDYLALFSVVFQDFALFPLWLGENVATGKSYDETYVKDCLSKSGFSTRLDTMPDGLNTVLYKTFDEEGTDVSGGEAQKIALARALYKNAPIVVLDEPTAALDPIAEYEVYTTFDNTIGDKTAVFISHRLSSCRFCDVIAVFDGGKLAQLGAHEDLLEDHNGRYHELWEAQAAHYRDEAKSQ